MASEPVHLFPEQERHPRSEVAPPARSQAEVADAALTLNPELDRDGLARSFEANRRVRVPGFLSDGAMALYDHLQDSADWLHLMTSEAGVLELDVAAKRRMGAAKLEALALEGQERARHSFQYRYEAIRIPDAGAADRELDLLDRFADLMASPDVLAALSEIVGTPVGGFTDGQATAYGPGDFLTVHDDGVEGKDRLAAFVFGLTPGWRIDWGGMLLFHGERSWDAEALTPRFNTLDLFAVPQPHSVSLVSRAAAHRRYALTGWLTRAR